MRASVPTRAGITPRTLVWKGLAEKKCEISDSGKSGPRRTQRTRGKPSRLRIVSTCHGALLRRRYVLLRHGRAFAEEEHIHLLYDDFLIFTPRRVQAIFVEQH